MKESTITGLLLPPPASRSTRARSRPECDRKSSSLTVGLRLPRHSDDGHAETRLLSPSTQRLSH